MKQASVWFVILAYYSLPKKIQELLKALSQQSVVIVDNTPEVEKRFLRAIGSIYNDPVIETEKNLGYANGMNVGIGYALKQHAEWIVVLNDDAELTKADIDVCLQTLATTKPGVAGPIVGSLDARRWTTIVPSRNKSFDYISGSMLAVHKDVVKSVGAFYGPYFMYYEDVDLCVRAERAGFTLTGLPLVNFQHQEKKKKKYPAREYYLARNHLLFVKRLAPISIKFHEIIRMPKTLMEHATSGNLGARAGVLDFARSKFGMYKEA